MTVGLFGAVRWSVVANAPVVASILRVTMAIPQKIHSVIDDDVRAWSPHKVGDCEGVDNPRRRDEMPGRLLGRAISRRCRSPLVVEFMEAAKRIDDLPFEKRK